MKERGETMKKIEPIEGIPNWAVCGLVNGDWSGTPDEDRKMAEEWEKELNKDGYILMSPIDGTECGFNRHPAFGLACDTVDFYAIKEEVVK